MDRAAVHFRQARKNQATTDAAKIFIAADPVDENFTHMVKNCVGLAGARLATVARAPGRPFGERTEASECQHSRVSALEVFTAILWRLTGAGRGLSLHRRRAVISALIDRIVVHPAVQGGNPLDPKRLEPTWRA
jgi:hypothetical protein